MSERIRRAMVGAALLGEEPAVTPDLPATRRLRRTYPGARAWGISLAGVRCARVERRSVALFRCFQEASLIDGPCRGLSADGFFGPDAMAAELAAWLGVELGLGDLTFMAWEAKAQDLFASFPVPPRSPAGRRAAPGERPSPRRVLALAMKLALSLEAAARSLGWPASSLRHYTLGRPMPPARWVRLQAAALEAELAEAPSPEEERAIAERR